MSELVSILGKQLQFYKFDKGEKIRASHDIAGSLLPFMTRAPERPRFRTGFTPIVGVIARILNDKSVDMDMSTIGLQQLPIDTDVDEDTVKKLFSSTIYQKMNSPQLLQYLPLSEGSERKGEIKIGSFLVDLLSLKDNPYFVKSFRKTQPSNLYEKVVFELLASSDGAVNRHKGNFIFYDNHYFKELFNRDIENLVSDKEYFYSHISELLQFYYFVYVTQFMLRVSDSHSSPVVRPVYFTLEDEPVSRSRQAVQLGFRIIHEHGRNLLIDVDLLNYLNCLIPNQHAFYWKSEILSQVFPYKQALYQNLVEFLPEFYSRLGNEITHDISMSYSNLEEAVNCLWQLLYNRSETNDYRPQSSRYVLSFDEIVKQGYVRQHGSLGRVFSISSETLLTLVTAIVGHNKMPLKDVFSALQAHGVYFDRISRDKVIQLFEQANILEKLSDSGDAQYVRGIL